jgi:tetratricopeptide (TPR) repeat protein
MKGIVILGWLMIVVIVIPTVARAQDEGTAYANFFAEEDCKTKAPLGEKFMADYKMSQYVEPAFQLTLVCYSKLNNYPKVLDLAGRLEQLAPSMKPTSKANMYARAMEAAQQSNDAAQTIAFGEKVLAIVPDSDPMYLNTAITLSSTLAIANQNDMAALQKAEGYGQKALATLSKMDGKSLGLSDAEWATQKIGIEGSVHNTLGTIYFSKKDYDKAVDDLVVATKDLPKDGQAFYLLGLSYQQQYASQLKPYLAAVAKSNADIKAKAEQAVIDEGKATADGLADALHEKQDKAIDALATAAALGGPTQAPAMDELKKLYTTKKGSTDGLDRLIQSKKPAP